MNKDQQKEGSSSGLSLSNSRLNPTKPVDQSKSRVSSKKPQMKSYVLNPDLALFSKVKQARGSIKNG
jgi:hypothetical protein